VDERRERLGRHHWRVQRYRLEVARQFAEHGFDLNVRSVVHLADGPRDGRYSAGTGSR
jgi:hypothetical protein